MDATILDQHELLGDSLREGLAGHATCLCMRPCGKSWEHNMYKEANMPCMHHSLKTVAACTWSKPIL